MLTGSRNSADVSARAADKFAAAFQYLSRPDRLRRLRWFVAALLCLWLLVSLAKLVWALVPAPAPQPVSELTIINPATREAVSSQRSPVDVKRLQGQHLFGDASAAQVVEVPVAQQAEKVSEREGIEDGARETRLKLVLRGVVSASEDGLGHAIIESRNQQDVYAVDDELPESGKVLLAKVLPDRVVLDNNGTYELLTLYEESDLDGQLQQRRTVTVPAAKSTPAATSTPAAASGDVQAVDNRSDEEVTALATSYRDQLYRNPQSLAEVVRISAVRTDGQLLGYRIAPGADTAKFSQLGFKAGDIVTGVNGIALDNPSQAMRLYQTMRTANEAVFDLQRGEQAVSISVSLDPAGG